MANDFLPKRYIDSIERYQDEDGNPEADRIVEMGMAFEDPFDENEPEEIFRLREFSASLDGRLADVYEALLVKYAGGKERIPLKEIARKWGVSTAQIYKDKDRVVRMIKEKIKSPSDLSY